MKWTPIRTKPPKLGPLPADFLKVLWWFQKGRSSDRPFLVLLVWACTG